MPSLMIHGQIVGKWKQKNGKLSVELFDKLDEKEKKTVKEKAEMLWDNLKKIEFL